jgi:EmrB/QacA subfamily drug resistance transporter
MLAVALPELRRDFGVGHAEIAWLVSAYLIAMAVAQPLGGRLGDQLGRAAVFRTGLLLFLALSLAAAAAPNYPLLIASRTGQAVVGAAVIPNGFAMMRESVPVTHLGRSSGLTGSAMSAAAAVGPLLGAALLSAGSWRLLFLTNVPLVLSGLLALHLLRYRAAKPVVRPTSLDWFGAGAFAAALAVITVLLNGLRGEGSTLFLTASAVAFPIVLAVFVRRQFSAETPIAEWRLFRIRAYFGATGYILLSNLVMYTTLLALPFFVEEVQGGGNLTSGTLLGAVSIPVALFAPIGGRLSDGFGRRPLVLVGSLLIAAATGALAAGVSREAPYVFLAALLGIMGIGLGLSTGPAGAAAVESTPRELAGTAAGTNSMMRYVGSIIGVGILGAVLNTDDGAPEVGLFRIVFAVLAVMAALGVACALLVHRFPAEERPVPEAAPSVPGARAASAG